MVKILRAIDTQNLRKIMRETLGQNPFIVYKNTFNNMIYNIDLEGV